MSLHGERDLFLDGGRWTRCHRRRIVGRVHLRRGYFPFGGLETGRIGRDDMFLTVLL
jgi:hypothetical protein